MSNDNKTLADAQPGGRVRLGDALLPCPFCGAPAERIDFGIGSGENEGGSCIACTVCQHSGPIEFGYKENFVSNWNRRAISAQPSPGGQDGLNYERMFVDACAALAEVSRELGCDPEQGGAEPILAAIAELREALAARQPVGDPEIWVSPGQLEEHKRRPAGQGSNYLPTRLACEGNFTQPLYAAPAQAVDLDELRRAVCVVNVVGQIDGHDVVRRNSVLDVIDVRRQRQIASQAEVQS